MSGKSKAKRDSLDAQAKAKLRAAFHEAGRFVAAKHFGVAEVCGLHRVGNAGQFTGKTVFSPTSAFNEAVIGWAGALAEMMLGRTPEQWRDVRGTVWEMFAANQLTKTDSDLISRDADKKKTFAQAAKITLENFAEIREAAVTLFKFDSLFNFP